MNPAIDIINSNGKHQSERFNRARLHNSIVNACLSVRAPEGQAESIARYVSDAVIAWLEKRFEVTSNDIRIVAARHLRKHHPEAAYLYEQQRITI